VAKLKTLSEAETARRLAVTGLHNLGRDEDADRIESLSAREYADEKGFEIIENPSRKRRIMPRRMKSREELQAELEELRSENVELQAENEDLQDQIDAVAEAIGVEEEEDDEGEDGETARTSMSAARRGARKRLQLNRWGFAPIVPVRGKGEAASGGSVRAGTIYRTRDLRSRTGPDHLDAGSPRCPHSNTAHSRRRCAQCRGSACTAPQRHRGTNIPARDARRFCGVYAVGGVRTSGTANIGPLGC